MATALTKPTSQQATCRLGICSEHVSMAHGTGVYYLVEAYDAALLPL